VKHWHRQCADRWPLFHPNLSDGNLGDKSHERLR
jgi:hypothetical protein